MKRTVGDGKSRKREKKGKRKEKEKKKRESGRNFYDVSTVSLACAYSHSSNIEISDVYIAIFHVFLDWKKNGPKPVTTCIKIRCQTSE